MTGGGRGRHLAGTVLGVLALSTAGPLAMIGLVKLGSLGERRADVALAWAVAAMFLVRFVVFAVVGWVMWRRTRTADSLGTALLLLFGGMAVMALAFAVAYGAALLGMRGVPEPAWLRWSVRLVVAETAVETTLAGLLVLAALRELGLLRDAPDS